jgi:hypothetical protein
MQRELDAAHCLVSTHVTLVDRHRWTWQYEDCEVGVSCVLSKEGECTYQIDQLDAKVILV